MLKTFLNVSLDMKFMVSELNVFTRNLEPNQYFLSGFLQGRIC